MATEGAGSTVHTKTCDGAALLIAEPDYTGEDWDAAVRELVTSGYQPTVLDTPIHVLPDGTEIHLWAQHIGDAGPESSEMIMAATTVLTTELSR